MRLYKLVVLSLWFFEYNVDNLILIAYRRQKVVLTFLYLSRRDELFLYFFFVYFCNFRILLNLNAYMSTGSKFFLDLMAEV